MAVRWMKNSAATKTMFSAEGDGGGKELNRVRGIVERTNFKINTIQFRQK